MREYSDKELAKTQAFMGALAQCKAENAKLREALEPFAKHAHCVNEVEQSDWALWCAQAVNALEE